MQAAVAAVEGGVDVLINNAGYSQSGALETLPMDAVRRQFETNVFGLLRLTQLVLPGMREAGAGKIVNVSSMGGRLTFPGGGAYHATKYAVEAMSDALRMEVRAASAIDVICVEPGLIRTEFGATAAGGVASDDGRPVRRLQRGGREVHPRRLRGPAVAAGRRRRRRRRGDREGAGASRAPPTRVPVTASARVLMGLRRVLPDRAWDRVVGASLRMNGPERLRRRAGPRLGRRARASCAPAARPRTGCGSSSRRSPGSAAARCSVRYALAGADEAREYLAHPVLGPRLRECTELVARPTPASPPSTSSAASTRSSCAPR